MSQFQNFLFLLLFVQLTLAPTWTSAANHGKPTKPSMSGPETEKMIMDKIKSASPELLAKAQRQAARKLQGNFAKTLSTMASKRASASVSTLEIPLEVREYIKIIMAAIKSGKLSGPIMASLGDILMESKANPAQQIQTTINEVLPRAPANLKNPLEGLMTFVKENQAGVNTLLDKLIIGTPHLLHGVVQSLASTVGATNAAIGGSTESLNQMVGGLLAGLPVGGLLPGR